ncbi:SGNH/GDSL hydrolase family protein [Agromyces sp. GXS1127]|uniref:SGNH/GDSL hydrolase family protein n=1 Tax=Agromyces sp. GXS1127 TaxID=3424181 RepID=UPI003D31E728
MTSPRGAVAAITTSRAGRRRAGTLVAIVAGAAVLVGCSAPAGPAPDRVPGRTAAAEPSATAVSRGTFAAVGDSITDADSPDFAAGDLGPGSWATYVVADGVEFAGGWAEWGATTEQMAASVAPVEADALVVLAGTNDLAFGISFEVSAANLDRIVRTVGIDDVLVASIPPFTAVPAAAEAYNASLEELADDRGWRFVDASAGLRTADGRFAEGMSSDGLHPSEAGARVLGEAIGAALRED